MTIAVDRRAHESSNPMSARRSIARSRWPAAVAAAALRCGGTSSATSDVLDAASAVGAAASGAVTVSPLPGTPDASPQTQISFLGGRGHPGVGCARRRVAQRHSRGQPARLLDRDGRELPAVAPLPDGGARERPRARGLRRGDADGQHELHDRQPGHRSARSSSRSTRVTQTRSSTTAPRHR